eukprot:352193-Chlamydomonas_euryale.AAC.9
MAWRNLAESGMAWATQGSIYAAAPCRQCCMCRVGGGRGGGGGGTRRAERGERESTHLCVIWMTLCCLQQHVARPPPSREVSPGACPSRLGHSLDRRDGLRLQPYVKHLDARNRHLHTVAVELAQLSAHRQRDGRKVLHRVGHVRV